MLLGAAGWRGVQRDVGPAAGIALDAPRCPELVWPNRTYELGVGVALLAVY